MSFDLTHSDLERLCQLNAFPYDSNDLVFFGFRGCVPKEPKNHTFAGSQTLTIASLNYRNPRCSLGQWQPTLKTLAVFPGSTVPTAKYVETAASNSGAGANQLFTGRYAFIKGVHNADSPNGHEAFRQNGNRIFRRTSDDAVYESTDPAYIGNPWDNLHAAFGAGLDGNYSSAGCQVVMGFPECRNYNEAGPWEAFQDFAYERQQREFTYILLDASDANESTNDILAQQPLQLRCGSHEAALASSHRDVIRQVQTALRQKGFYSGPIDGDFGAGSTLALWKFQRNALGATLADAIVGPVTAEALGLPEWPTI